MTTIAIVLALYLLSAPVSLVCWFKLANCIGYIDLGAVLTLTLVLAFGPIGAFAIFLAWLGICGADIVIWRKKEDPS